MERNFLIRVPSTHRILLLLVLLNAGIVLFLKIIFIARFKLEEKVFEFVLVVGVASLAGVNTSIHFSFRRHSAHVHNMQLLQGQYTFKHTVDSFPFL